MALTVDNCAVVYFTMRLLGHGRHGHILQLAAKFANGRNISVWIEPSTYVAENASEVDGLEARYGKLFYYNEFLPTVPLEVAMRKLLMFLKSSPKPVVIVSHSGQFYFVLLLQAIMETDMVDQFDSIVVGFSDSLPRFIEVCKDRKGVKQFELEPLAYDILGEKYEEKFLGAVESLEVLEKLVNARSLTTGILEHHKCFEKSLLNEMGAQYSFEIVEGLVCLREIVTIGVIKRLAEAGASCSSLVKMYREQGTEKLKKFLSEKQANGKARITEASAVHEKLIAFLQKPQKPRAIEDTHHDQDMPEINKNIPIYAQIDPFKKRQDRINRELDLLRQQQSKDYEDVDLLRRPDPYQPPTDRYRRPSWRIYQSPDNASASTPSRPTLDPSNRPTSGLYEDLDSVQIRNPAPRSVDPSNGPTSGLYEDPDSLKNQAPNRWLTQARPESGLYEDPDSVQNRNPVSRSVDRSNKAESGIYEDPDSLKNQAPNRWLTQARPESGLYENIDSVQPRTPVTAARPADRYTRLSEGLYEDPEAYRKSAAEETVELRTKRQSQGNRAAPNGGKRFAMYGNRGK